MYVQIPGEELKIVFRYEHLRDSWEDPPNLLEKNVNMTGFGRLSICEIYNASNMSLLSYGQAACSESDNFNKVIGRKLALTRALKGVFEAKDRATIWEQVKKKMRIKP